MSNQLAHPAPPTPTVGPARPDVVARYSGFRPEVQGLRAVAVLLVVIYHVFMGRVSGGVDIFLLISAFFMTMSFVRKIEGDRPLAIGRYWVRTFTRLLPLAVLIILLTLGAVAVCYPTSVTDGYRAQGVLSAFYVENWSLALASVDYYAADHSTASPFQHFWSLSVQGQVFVLWPLVFVVAWWVRRWFRVSCVPVLAVLFSVIFGVSLWFSVVSTAGNQAFAYFDTRARLWEFALGSLIALVIPFVVLPRVVRVVLGWLGIVGMVSVGLLVDVQGAFPGWIALWPLLSAAAIIVAGRSGSAWGFDRFLSWSPVVKLGDAAYALYLVHWPLLITYLVLQDRPAAEPVAGVAIVGVSLALAVALTRWVENPLKRWPLMQRSAVRQAHVVLICWGLVLGAALPWQDAQSHRLVELQEHAGQNNPGAASLMPGFEFRGDPAAPTLPVVGDDYPKPPLGDACPQEMGLREANEPWCGMTLTQPEAQGTILAVGNSHMMQWLPAVEELARRNNWNVVSYIRGNCVLGSAAEQATDAPQCRNWLADLEKVTDHVDPDVVVVNGTRSHTDGGESITRGMRERMSELADGPGHLLAIRDNPRFDEAPGVCAQERGRDASECTPQKQPMVGSPNPVEALTGPDSDISTVDMGDLICPDGTCTPVIGNVVVYWDTNHLTQDYVRTLAPMFADRAERTLREAGITGGGA